MNPPVLWISCNMKENVSPNWNIFFEFTNTTDYLTISSHKVYVSLIAKLRNMGFVIIESGRTSYYWWNNKGKEFHFTTIHSRHHTFKLYFICIQSSETHYSNTIIQPFCCRQAPLNSSSLSGQLSLKATQLVWITPTEQQLIHKQLSCRQLIWCKQPPLNNSSFLNNRFKTTPVV